MFAAPGEPTPERTAVSTTLDAPRANAAGVPSTDIDLHTEENLLKSPEVFATLRGMGPVVWLEKYQMYALPRFAEVSRALRDWETFNSGEGVVLNEVYNSLRQTSLQTHGDLHDEIKHVESRPLAPERLRELAPKLREYAEGLVRDLTGRSRVDGVRDIAMRMPMDVITELVGLDDAGRDRVYEWGVAAFDSAGPMHAARTAPALRTIQGFLRYAEQNIPSRIRPGGWADQLFRHGRAAGWSEDMCRGVMIDYVFPSLDTTIHAMSTGLLLFAQNPEQWDKIRADRTLLKSAVLEIVRMATPAQYFTRLVTRDCELAGALLPAGSRVMLMYGSANRDEREFPEPDRFEIERNPAQMVAWGGGKHVCLGRALARMEITILFDVLADHFERLDVGAYSYAINNMTRGLEHMELSLTRASND